jgi:type II secretory pathway pseudopilin PulG
VIGLGAWDVSLSQQLGQQNRLLAQANQQNQQLQQQNRQLVQQVSQPSIYTLNGQGPLAGASGQVKALKTDPVLIFQFSGLPQPPPGKVYEIWLIPPPGAGAAIRGGVFSPDRSGSATVSIARTLDGIKIVAVTVENGPNGVDAPSQTPPLAGQVA